MTGLFDLTGKVTVITGGAGGIGRSLALGMVERGADVVVADSNLTPFEELAKKVRAMGRQALAVEVDVTDEQSVADMVERVLAVFSRIDILVNSAGTNAHKPADSLPIDEWQQVMDVNIRGTFLTCQAVGREMIKQNSGKIVNMSSIRGRYGVPRDGAAYCTSKGAVDTLTRTLACEWAKHNVLVNAVAPSIVETERNRSRLANPEGAERMKTRIPLGRWAQLEDIVGPVVFLASNASDFVTGQVIYVDGGISTW